MPFAATWMDLEIIIVSEISQREKDKYLMILLICELPRWSSGKESACQHRRYRLYPCVRKTPGMGNDYLLLPTPIFLPGKFHKPRNLVVYSPLGCKEFDMTEHGER